MKKKKENPPPPAKDVTEMFTMHDVRMGQIQIQTTLDEVLRECKALRIEERTNAALIMRKMGAITADLHILSVLPSASPPPVTQLMMRETLDKDGKVMTREFIPVSRRGL